MKKSSGNSLITLFVILLSIVSLFGFSFVFLVQKKPNSDNNSSDSVFEESSTKHLCCKYDNSYNVENSYGGLRIFVPTDIGYINYNIVHTRHSGINADVWRIGQAFAFDNDLKDNYAITSYGAEWDMAVRIQGRDDFIGGVAHGDEKSVSFSLTIDNDVVDITTITELQTFSEIKILVTSYGYDPSDHETQVLKHEKEYIVNSNGVTLSQKVEWLGEYTMSTSYLAMMPPLKSFSDMYYTNVDYTPTLITYGTTLNVTKAVVYGKNLTYTMSIPKYPSLTGGDRFLLQDNGGLSYNKMYFVVCNGHTTSVGEIWESTTCYQIRNS